MANTILTTSTNITISGGGLIATCTSGSGGIAASPDFHGLLSGYKFYFEATVNVTTDAAGDNAIGVCIPGQAFTPSGVGMAASYFTFSNGLIYTCGSQTGINVGAPLVAADILCVAVDLVHGLIWFRKNGGNWNNNVANNPATAIGGVSLTSPAGNNPASGLSTGVAPCVNLHAVNDAVTFNFGNSAFIYAVPSGFTSGWTAGTLNPVSALATQIGVDTWAVVQHAPIQVQASQIGVETWVAGFPAAQVTALHTTEWGKNNPPAQLTGVFVEEWGTGPGSTIGLISTVFVEEWASVALARDAQTTAWILT